MLTKDYLKKIKREGGAVLSDIFNSGRKKMGDANESLA